MDELTGDCLQCSNGYLPFQNRCVYYDPYCLEYDASRVCSKAFPGFFISSFSDNEKNNYRNIILESGLNGRLYAQENGAGSGSGSGGSGGSENLKG